MSSTRHHHPLPAPVVHAGFTVSQSKSNVLAGVQDAYWSDDEGEDADCPLCLEEMDISDVNFKPCICGYQICRFCWHHIKENLNGRCPACRRVYTDEAVQFKPIAKEDHKRLTQQKKQRERERKDLEALGRRQLANVRVVQRNVVYVVGIGPRFAKEELIPTLRSSEYFGQYGKITKLLLVKRTPSGGGAPVVGVYITYHRREDAARAIAAVDGTASPGGGREIMRASYGTTKYCMAFLRGVSCSDKSCMNWHEWGDEKDCFTKEDLTTLKHTMKATETRSRTSTVSKKSTESEGLPRAAAWGNKGSTPSASSSLHSSAPGNTHLPAVASTSRQTRRTGTRQLRSTTTPSSTATESRYSSVRSHQERRSATTGGPTKTPSQASSSRPTTPATSLPQRPNEPHTVKESHPPLPSSSPAPSVAAESDVGSGSADAAPLSPATRPQSAESVQSSVPSGPPGIAAPAAPPGLSAPPGLPAPNRPARVETPQTPLLASQSSYQMSSAARALLDDVKARRDTEPLATVSPFPDFDRTLQTLLGDSGEFGGFSFNMDLALAGSEASNADDLPDFSPDATTPFHGNYMDAFPAIKLPSQSSPALMPPPGLSYSSNPISSARAIPIPGTDSQSTGGTSYTGSFNPFADPGEDLSSSSARLSHPSSADDNLTRNVSRFGFARVRQGSTAASSPLNPTSPLLSTNSQTSIYTSTDISTPAQSQLHVRSHVDYGFSQPGSAMGSPLAQHAQANPLYAPPSNLFQPFDSGVSEAQLRDLIQSSRLRSNSDQIDQDLDSKMTSGHHSFNDPAIMSASFSSPSVNTVASGPAFAHNMPPGGNSVAQLAFGSPPPGLAYSHNAFPSQLNAFRQDVNAGHPKDETYQKNVPRPLSITQSIPLSTSDFPTLTPIEVSPVVGPRREDQLSVEERASALDTSALAKAEKKAAKKVAAAEKAAERQKIAKEKAVVKAAEKARIAQEKATEKEKAAAVKEEQDKAAQTKLDLENGVKEAADKEKGRTAQAEKKKATQVEIERTKRAKSVSNKSADAKSKRLEPERSTSTSTSNAKPSRPTAAAAISPTSEPVTQVPLLSKKPKKHKAAAKPIRVLKDEDTLPAEPAFTPSTSSSDIPAAKHTVTAVSSSSTSRAQSIDQDLLNEPTSLEELFEEIDIQNPAMDLPRHPFFDTHKINPAAKMPLEYGPLVHALSALSVGGGSFANNMPSGSIDNAVSSFQQLLETLTQTISDLLRLLPRTTWDDSSSFDGVLRDMLKGDDVLDEGAEEVPGKDDEVAALTLALERRARWMEVQLSKLEELHRDINTAAVRAVLSFNDSGWDKHGFMPCIGKTLKRFDAIGTMEVGGLVRPMTADELEKKLAVAKEAAVFAEAEVRDAMEKMASIKPVEID